MEIFLKTGKETVLLRGGEHAFELCWKRTRKEKDGTTFESWEAGKWFVAPEHALEAVLRMKISNSDAKTLKELKTAIEEARRELTACWNTEIKMLRRGDKK